MHFIQKIGKQVLIYQVTSFHGHFAESIKEYGEGVESLISLPPPSPVRPRACNPNIPWRSQAVPDEILQNI